MRISLIASTALAGTLALSACQRDHSDLVPATSATSEAADPVAIDQAAVAPALGMQGEGMTTARYVCDGNHSVEITDDATARVTLADGRTVDLARASDSAPPTYAGETWEFSVVSPGGTLRQDEAGSIDCRSAS